MEETKEIWNVDDFLETKLCIEYDATNDFNSHMSSYDEEALKVGLERRFKHKIVNKRCGMQLGRCQPLDENEFHLKFELGRVDPLARYVE